MRKLKPALYFLLLGAFAILLIHRDEPREVIDLFSWQLLMQKESWERSNRARAGSEVMAHILDDLIYKEVLVREALRLRFHQADNIVWTRLIRNMRSASQVTAMEDEELFRQALSLELHRSDLVVRRRLIARMERFIKNNYLIEEPDDSDVNRFITENPDLFSRGKRVSFCHVFLSSGGAHEDAEASAKMLLRELRKGNTAPEKAYKLGDMFPHPYCFRNASSSYVKNIFGQRFTDALLAGEARTWSGPVQSGYGTHLVRLEAKHVTHVPALPENRKRARNILITEREKRLVQDMARELANNHYTIVIDGVPAGDYRLEQLLDIKANP